MNSLNWLDTGCIQHVKLPVACTVLSCAFIKDGSQALLTTQNGCYVAHLKDSWECEHLFHQSESPIRVVKVVPCPSALRILCVYSNFASLFEIKNTENDFSTTILKTYYGFPSPILCCDTQENHFVLVDHEGTVVVQAYDSDAPVCTIHYSDVEELCSMKSVSRQFRRIRKVAFNKSGNKALFAFISSEICCVYDLAHPDKPVSFITIRSCPRSDTKHNVPNRFRSFTFFENDVILLLTDMELYKWNYLAAQPDKAQATCLFSIQKKVTLRDIACTSTGGLIEILSTEGISLFSLTRQEGEILHERTPAEGATHLNTIHLTRVCSFDSILDSPHKKYTLLVSREIPGLLQYTLQVPDSMMKMRKKHAVFGSYKNEHLLAASPPSTRSDSFVGSEVACDMEEVAGSLSVSDSNSGLSLLRFSLPKGVLVVGYDLLQTRVDVTVSFHRELDGLGASAASTLSHTSFSNSTTQLTAASYAGLVIDVRPEQPNARLEGVMDYVRTRVHTLVEEARATPTSADGRHALKAPNRLRTLLTKILRLFDDVNHALPAEAKPVASQPERADEGEAKEGAAKEGAVENDDFLVEAPSLFFAVMCNDVMIRVTNDRVLHGVDLASNPPMSYYKFKHFEKHSSYDESESESEGALFAESESESDGSTHKQMCSQCSMVHLDDSPCITHHSSFITLDYSQHNLLSLLHTAFVFPRLSVTPSPASIATIADAAQRTLDALSALHNPAYFCDINRRIILVKLLKALFTHVATKASNGAVFFVRSTLNHCWNSVVEEGDLFSLAVLVAYCRVYSRAMKTDVLQCVENSKRVDADNMLIALAEVFDRRQLWGRKMETLKYVLNSAKLAHHFIVSYDCPNGPKDSQSSSSTPNNVRNSRNRSAEDEDAAPARRGSARTTEGVVTEFSTTPGDENGGSPTGMLCAVCRQPVQGLFVICQFCRHAFHVAHYREWFAANEYCPVVDCHHCCNHSQTADASPLCVSCTKPAVGIDHSSFPLE